MKSSPPVVVVALLSLAACGPSTTTITDCTTTCRVGYVCRSADGVCVPDSTGAGGGTNGDSGGGSGTTPQGLPCDVAALLGARCISCHAATPTAGAPNALVTRDDLLRTSPSGATYAARSLIRVKDAQAPMPPAFTGDAASATEIAALAAWVNAGLPGGACASATSSGSGGGTGASGGGTGASGGGTGASGGGTGASGGGTGASGGGTGASGGGTGTGTGGGSGSAYCRACSSDAACGGANNFCIGFSFGNYCGVDCSTSTCPVNQRCVGITDGVSTIGHNCVPLTGATCGGGTGGGSGGTGGGSGGTGGGSGGTGGGSAGCTTDTWANYGQSFFANNCNSCHQHTGEFTTRTSVLNKKSNISNRINVGNMPPGGLSASATTRIMTYLNCGVP